MGSFVLVLVPVFLVCGGAALLISSLVKSDTGRYDIDNLWEDREYTSDDYNLK
ncbi:hypothetical protein LCY76_16375 [Fictibacillus sp. KIGAM418]|uniref:Uncharacterized protein n=1 Tax=Fictibacillus marinisediminis TaxID=2878389 RepID=A0A9X1XCG8_9BACL|nr:hypothetical protein [Fictibacillus marinisediminis]MCK6258154.1 hypothetical protein [Fictibacillus marinisediminis]